MTCNPKNPKSKNPLYKCNPKTNRWIKISRNPKNPKAKTSAKPCKAKHVDVLKISPEMQNIHYKCSTNKSTDQAISNSCFKKVENTVLTIKVGEGSFGAVYKASGIYKNQKIQYALKVMKGTQLSFSKYVKEVEYYHFMDHHNLGPKIYDSFFVVQKGIEYHYIAMELFDSDVSDLLASGKSVAIKKSAVIQMISLLKRQLKLKLDCQDIKPGNFLYDTKTNTVKITDFGGDFCKMTKSGKNDDVILFRNIYILYIMVVSQVRNEKISLPLNAYLKSHTKNDKMLKKLYTFLKSPIDDNACSFTHYTGVPVRKQENFIVQIKRSI
jgi:hypothetical protein